MAQAPDACIENKGRLRFKMRGAEKQFTEIVCNKYCPETVVKKFTRPHGAEADRRKQRESVTGAPPAIGQFGTRNGFVDVASGQPNNRIADKPGIKRPLQAEIKPVVIKLSVEEPFAAGRVLQPEDGVCGSQRELAVLVTDKLLPQAKRNPAVIFPKI